MEIMSTKSIEAIFWSSDSFMIELMFGGTTVVAVEFRDELLRSVPICTYNKMSVHHSSEGRARVLRSNGAVGVRATIDKGIGRGRAICIEGTTTKNRKNGGGSAALELHIDVGSGWGSESRGIYIPVHWHLFTTFCPRLIQKYMKRFPARKECLHDLVSLYAKINKKICCFLRRINLSFDHYCCCVCLPKINHTLLCFGILFVTDFHKFQCYRSQG